MSLRIVDVHAHAILPQWRSAFEAATGQAPGSASVGGIRLPPWSPEQHLAYMDRQQIAAGILSWPEGTLMLRGRAARDLARSMNEAYAEIIVHHPSRFGAFATLPMDDMDAAVDEMAYALDVLGLEGVTATTQFEGTYLGDPYYETLFAEMNRRQTTLFAHPGIPKGLDAVDIGINVSTLEFMFDTTRMVTNLVAGGAKRRFPDISIISTHGGGTIPYLVHRLAISLPFFAKPGRPELTSQEVTADLASFFYDLTAATSPAQLDAMRRLVPASRLMMGFDYPMMPEPTTAPEIAAWQAYEGFDDAQRTAIGAGNALQLFPRLAGQLHR